MRQAYPSDITREQFEVVRYILESAKKETRPMDYDLYDVFCAVLYRGTANILTVLYSKDTDRIYSVFFHTLSK